VGKETTFVAAACTRFLLHRPFLAQTWHVRADYVAKEEGHAGTARATCPHTGPPARAPFHVRMQESMRLSERSSET
jgi:hypothetical protein